ncbi:GGDEF domain-containing protein [Pseudomonas sp. Gutcm_11s]|uniref:GGDEF domain-containing protein n=1 Tax=Pseudomonas sp. Gutcm_11s TaxID=3026088 RepID=UPI003081EDAC
MPPPPRGPRQTGLEDSARRSLMSLIFAATGLTIGGFSILQFLADNALFASVELLVCAALLWASRGIYKTHHLELWIYLYLVPVCAFLVYITLMPEASSSAFVWTYLIPLLSYLLLGKQRGLRLAVPFLGTALLLYYWRYPLPQTPHAMIDAGNAILCGALILVFVHLYETRRAVTFSQIEHQAQTDPLTGVASRGHFKQELLRALQEAQRSDSPLVLVLMDIDHFKAVNDRWGHEAGDHALRHICDLLLERLRVTDTLGRLGGEEFGLLLRSTDLDSAKPLVEALRELISSHPLHYGEQPIALSATFGLAQWPQDGVTTDELYRCADARLYAGKQQGRNCLVSGNLEMRISDTLP